VALPGVGKNLQDHYECPVVATTKGSFGYYGGRSRLADDQGWPAIPAVQVRPCVSTTGVETCAFYDPDGDNDRPTIQMFCVPTVYLDRDVMGTEPGDGVTINSLLLRPKARGRSRWPRPTRSPTRSSTRRFSASGRPASDNGGFRFARTVLSASPMRELIDKEIFPGINVTSDEAIAAHCKRTVKTGYHPCRHLQDGP
jgi:choline dehydrogenase